MTDRFKELEAMVDRFEAENKILREQNYRTAERRLRRVDPKYRSEKVVLPQSTRFFVNGEEKSFFEMNDEEKLHVFNHLLFRAFEFLQEWGEARAALVNAHKSAEVAEYILRTSVDPDAEDDEEEDESK